MYFWQVPPVAKIGVSKLRHSLCRNKISFPIVRFENMFLTSLELEARKKARSPQNYEFELSLKVSRHLRRGSGSKSNPGSGFFFFFNVSD
jgi:hypothetical protein